MRFGIISTADIGLKSLLPAIQKSEHTAFALASRDTSHAERVAREYEIPRAYGSYEELLADDDVDAVYNPLPNALHAEWTKRAADHGKDVLCEKPLTGDAAEAAELFDYVRERDVTLMEAFMYRFHPRTERAVEIVERELGAVRSVDAAFSFSLDDDEDIRLDPHLAGGSVMDVGCYAVNAARLFLGEPERVSARTADDRGAGVDTSMAAVFEYDDATARVASGFDRAQSQYYRVETADGWLQADPAFGTDADESVTLEWHVAGRTVVEEFEPVDHYQLQVEAFADAVDGGSAPRITREETLGNMRAIDAIYESAASGAVVDVDSGRD
ncbi:glucose-fructose oxidoreductase [Salinigranum rubrum]|uniref:Glucose-fructose oxidoreductase n=1 Tax=Salinigranum rubrum TaxID=755307 RepID=A0A2I8VHU3_9EURY|nr:Gfo/Idh/MocA family oxidoreductase [Salinigranum rubrum]AUV80619.1 glucose-fructose oxidoreductase [Salinigranum rubrum]